MPLGLCGVYVAPADAAPPAATGAAVSCPPLLAPRYLPPLPLLPPRPRPRPDPKLDALLLVVVYPPPPPPPPPPSAPDPDLLPPMPSLRRGPVGTPRGGGRLALPLPVPPPPSLLLWSWGGALAYLVGGAVPSTPRVRPPLLARLPFPEATMPSRLKSTSRSLPLALVPPLMAAPASPIAPAAWARATSCRFF